MRVRAAIHERGVVCGGCGKHLHAGKRDYHLPARHKGDSQWLCGACGRAELRRTDRGRQNEAVAVADAVDLTVE
jgi:predicted RNA-binding Zn-ribbon protein involved in translation (DUF1610 family)